MICGYHIIMNDVFFLDWYNECIWYMVNKAIYLCNKTTVGSEKILKKWAELNPSYTIEIHDNTRCEAFLLKEYGEIYVELFRWLHDGPIKADFWRICILNTYGGVYADIDIEPIEPIDSFIEPDVAFVTCSSFWKKKGFLYNPNFIISEKKNPILKSCIQWYLTKYARKDTYTYWDWSIMKAFTEILHLPDYNKEGGIYYLGQQKIQIVKECHGENHYDSHTTYQGKRLFNNRSRNWNHQTHEFHIINTGKD